MALTSDTCEFSHAEQTRAFVDAGVGWVQLRMKNASFDRWLDTACECASIAHHKNAVLTINDSVDIAIASGADGVHLGTSDERWVSARERLGARAVLGGTVHNEDDARRSFEANVLDYVGIGPFRRSSTKADLETELGAAGIMRLLPLIGDIGAWAIGGILPTDVAELRHVGLCGVAICAALHYVDRELELSTDSGINWRKTVASNYYSFHTAWESSRPLL